MKKKFKKNKNLNTNQKSFFFEDYLETNKKNIFLKKNNIFQDRIYLLFFLFFSLILIFGIRIIHISLNNVNFYHSEKNSQNFSLNRRDIVDRNGELLSRSVKSYHAAINPKLIKNKNNLLIKLRINFPDLPIKKIERRLKKVNIFI